MLENIRECGEFLTLEELHRAMTQVGEPVDLTTVGCALANFDFYKKASRRKVIFEKEL